MYAGTAQLLNGLARDFLARGTLYQSCHLRCLRCFLPFEACNDCFPFQEIVSYFCQAFYICIQFYSYSKIGTNGNNMKIRVWTVLWTIIRKASNHYRDVDNCGDEDYCQYHLGIDHCQTRNCCQDREHCQNGNEQIDDQDQWSALKYN